MYGEDLYSTPSRYDDLDYDRTHHAPIDVQKKYFRMQLSLARKYHLPMFLHSRAAHQDFVQILAEEGFGTHGGRDVGGTGGVVHSFTGTTEEVRDYVRIPCCRQNDDKTDQFIIDEHGISHQVCG